MKTEITIPVSVESQLLDNIDRHNKRLKRHGLKVKAIRLGTKIVEKDNEAYEVVTYSIEGELHFSKNEAKVLCRIEHCIPVNLVTFYWRGEELLNGIDTLKCFPECEHCNQLRDRRFSYFILTSENKVMQVAKSCLKHYIDNVDMVLDFEENIADLEREIEGMKDTFSRGGYGTKIEILKPVKVVSEEVYKAYKVLGGYDKAKVRGAIFTGDLDGIKLSNEEIAKIESDIDYIKNYDYLNILYGGNKETYKECFAESFNSKVLTILERGYVSKSEYCIMGAIFKSLDFLKNAKAGFDKKQQEAKESKYYEGNIKDKIEVPVKIIGSYSYETQWGYSSIYTFRDEEGHVFKWSTASHIDRDKYAEGLILKGTIKEFNEYRGVKQTVLTRCKIA